MVFFYDFRNVGLHVLFPRNKEPVSGSQVFLYGLYYNELHFLWVYEVNNDKDRKYM